MSDILYLWLSGVLVIFCLYMAIKIHKKNKKKKAKAFSEFTVPLENKPTNEIHGKEKDTIEIKEVDKTSYNERREKSYTSYGNLIKSRKTHVVASFLHACIDLEYMPSIYDFEKKFENYDECRKELLLIGDYEFYIKQGIALYNKLRKDGVYTTRRATIKNDAHLIIEHQNIIDRSSYIIQACNNYEAYWDSELTRYKRKDAYLNRIDYLINYTTELLQKWYVRDNQMVEQKILQLRQKYIQMRNKT